MECRLCRHGEHCIPQSIKYVCRLSNRDPRPSQALPSPRRSANCASDVMASASSSTTSFTPVENSLRVPAKLLICSRTTSMPRSSEALSCSAQGTMMMQGQCA